MATAHLASSTGQPPTGRTWVLLVDELADGRVRVSGLPESRTSRLSVCLRVRDVLTGTVHTDDVYGQGDAWLWRVYCADVYTSAAAVTVELVEEAER